MSNPNNPTAPKTKRSRPAMSDQTRMWITVVHLACFGWALLLMSLLSHYGPEYRALIQPATSVLYLAIGWCLGANRRLFAKRPKN